MELSKKALFSRKIQQGNEAAESLAKEGLIGPEPVLGISPSLAEQTLNTSIGPFQGTYKSFENRHSRDDLRCLTDLLTGLNHHMSGLGLLENPVCRLCLEYDETAEHILCACPAVDSIRFSTFGRASLLP
ncbi:hypothetical protein JTB14_003556 [Gonioctena quinquepunctata]|nr:hypothetical protein JTB14_003556 [Gonioctena quinquepunctata]